jgi:nicotinamide-nucleotide amidase
MMAQMITSVPDASLVLNESLVVYSEMAKTKYLEVNPELINQFGVVSLEVARAMVIGLEKQTKADVCVSVTGYAGPTGEDIGKICFAIKYQDQLIVEVKRFRGNREMIRIRASRYILYRTHLLLK